MSIAPLVLQAWRGLLAAVPPSVLARLDGCARHEAERRAKRRREALLARR